MRAEDGTDTLDMALTASGCDQAQVYHKHRLLSDNGPSYIAGELVDYIEAKNEPCPWRSHASPDPGARSSASTRLSKNASPGKLLPARRLEAQIGVFVEHCKHWRYQESLDNVTPADAYFGKATAIINSAKGSNAKPSNIGTCNAARSPHNINPKTRPTLC